MAGHWYEVLAPGSSATKPTASDVSSLIAKAASLHANDGAPSKRSEASFLSKIVQSGTLSDRLSALTLLVQSDPVHNVKALETLKGMAERGKGQGGRDESLKALRCIVDWWVGGGAPNKKLLYFRDQPLLHADATDEHLTVWYFEDWLKKYFFSILQILEGLSLDPLPYVRTQSLNLISTLLRDKPEQEQNLLRLLVNKLGDPEKSICSRASYHLLQVIQAHPQMKAIVVREISSLILRPNKKIKFTDAPSSKPDKKTTANTHPRYYGAITLNQIVLSASPTDKTVAALLLDVYFDIFRDILGEDTPTDDHGSSNPKRKDDDDDDDDVKVDKKGRIFDNASKRTASSKHAKERIGAAGFTELEDSNARLVSAILTGVNRALPFAKLDGAGSRIEKHIDTLFLITHTSTFNTSLQALVLIQQISASLDAAAAAPSPPTTTASPPSPAAAAFTSTAKTTKDRYYRALYASLHDPRLASSSKQAMYLNLLFKSIKHDASLPSSSSLSASFAPSSARFRKKGRSRKPQEGGGEEAGDAGNNERVVALIRRFVQILVSSGNGTTEFVAGGLYLLGELFSTIPGLRNIINKPAASGAEGKEYDPKKREPQYAHASASPLWELTPLLHHFHPTIALCTHQLLTSQPLTASADLSQNTLSHFLDRFVYKNAKKVNRTAGAKEEGGAGVRMPTPTPFTTYPHPHARTHAHANPTADHLKARGPSAMQPAASGTDGVKLVRGEREDAVLMNDPQLLRKGVGGVPVDQRFFYDYFSNKLAKEKAKTSKISKRKGGGEGSDEGEAEGDEQEGEDDKEDEEEGKKVKKGVKEPEDEEEDEEDIGSELDEDEVWNAMQATMPRANDDDDLPLDSDVDEDSEVDLEGYMDSESDSGPDSEDDEGEENKEDGNSSEAVLQDEDDDIVMLGNGQDLSSGEDEDIKGSDDDDELAELSDNDDLLPLDAEVSLSLSHQTASEDEDAEWGGISSLPSSPSSKSKRKQAEESGKRKRGAEDGDAKSRKKMLRSLPTFASYEDYARLIEDGPEDDI